jgi:luciferase family oxidoreductase group 1
MTYELSVLDQSPVPEGFAPAIALRNSIDLAVACDRLGFLRYWVAEHHNSAALAGSSPEILIGHIAENTGRIRVGSGGVMLTHYAPLKVAESFKVLEALHPGRIDLGIGRAPGSDQRTAAALARGGQRLGIECYPSMVAELRDLLAGRVDSTGPLAGIEARPRTDLAPELWLLASSQDSAAIAAHLGTPLSWAHFISPGGEAICGAYRDQFSPSADCPAPRLSVGVSVLCAETESEAEALAEGLRAWRASAVRGPIPAPGRRRTTRRDPLAVTPADAGERRIVYGTPARVKGELDELAEQYRADEVIAVTICHDHATRVRSYELLAAEYGMV